ncbi:DivIVA domain-containing protein [Oscillospiraceae bacterium MB08-C2-2]|nr:DivIVA domain-containing protein [Oscillospiraceae bacterium MB08-C2-2]
MTPNMILDKKFDRGMSGYKADDVNAFLNEVYDYVVSLTEKNQELEEKLVVLAEKLEEYKEDEDSLRAALIGAQKLGDTVVRESKKKAEAILAEANQKSELIITRAKTQIDKEAMALTTIQREVSKFKTKLMAMYKQHLELINTIPNEAPQPELPVEAPLPLEREKETEALEVDTAEFLATVEDEPILRFEEISADEMEDEADIKAEEDASKKTVQFPHRKKGNSSQKFGNLRFGEGYDLTRHE